MDDDPRVCEATRALLQRWECVVELAAGAGDALASAQAGDAPDLLVLDVLLDGIDGPALYPRLCEIWKASPPVVLVTAERDESLRDLASDKGWGFLTKPVRPPALRALMTQLLLRRTR